MYGGVAQSDLEQGEPAMTQQEATESGAVGSTTVMSPTTFIDAVPRTLPVLELEDYAAMRDLLRREHQTNQNSNEESDEGQSPFTTRLHRTALDEMHRFNLQQAKLAVYTDYFEMKARTSAEKPIPLHLGETLLSTNVSENVSRYGKLPQ